MRPVLLACLLAAPLAADDVYLQRGGKILARDVMVTKETEAKVYWLDRSLKERSFAKAMVGRIDRRRTDVHELVDRMEAADTAAAFVELAAWAKERDFHDSALEILYRRALELDADDETANRALGRVSYKGEWMTPEEKVEREQADHEAAMRAQGLVKWKDEWVTPEDKAKLEQGYRKYEGRWMTEDEIKEAQGFVKHEGKWVRREELETLKLIGPARRDTGLGAALEFVQTDHFLVLGDLSPTQLTDLGRTMERLYAEWRRVFPDTDPTQLFGEGKYRLFVFRRAGPYQRLARALYDRLRDEGGHSEAFLKREEQRMRLRLRETSFWDITPVAQSAHVQMPDTYEGLKAHCVHFAANVLATRHVRVRFPTWWLNEGLAYYFEQRVTGSIQTFSSDVGATKYADQGPGDAKANPWLDAARWNQLLLGLVRTGRDPQLDRIKGRNLYEAKNRLTIQDLAKAHSVVNFLIIDDSRKFAEFYRDAKEGAGADEIEREVNAVIKHYGHYRVIEDRWRQFALNGFRVAR